MEGKIKMIEKEIKIRRKDMKNKTLMLGLGMGFLGIVTIGGAITGGAIYMTSKLREKEVIVWNKKQMVSQILKQEQKRIQTQNQTNKGFRWHNKDDVLDLTFNLDYYVGLIATHLEFKESINEAGNPIYRLNIGYALLGEDSITIYASGYVDSAAGNNQRVMLSGGMFNTNSLIGFELKRELK